MDFNAIRLSLASPDSILKWSYGEVLKPETINYRTQRPEKEGLFSEVIFGPEKDYQCYCGKYKKPRFKGIICDKCQVEVTHSSVRRERIGHIKLACPVAHIWFLRKLPSKIALLLDISLNDIEKVIYFASYIVINVDENARKERIKNIEKEFNEAQKKASLWGKKIEELSLDKLQELRVLQEQKRKALEQLNSLRPMLILSEADYRLFSQLYPNVFEAGIGAEVIRKILEDIDLFKLKADLENELLKAPEVQRKKIISRLSLVKGFIKSNIRPEWMFITILPVIPPDLRPMVQLDGGRFASSDVNDLYRRVINRNNRLKRLIELRAPEVILRNEKRMLQEAVDALIDNSARRTKIVMSTTGQPRPLKSLADMLKGKQGRFRRNLLGKRVDYSGRSVVVVGPELKLHECGLPKKIALEIFKPFVIQHLIKRGLAHNVRGAGHLIEAGIPEVWDILEEVTKNNLVLLNRAPTLHRLGIQAFQPILIEGLAIRLHPLVCAAFNADFDGDQMAVHLPLSEEAQEEARSLMFSYNNLLKPSTGKPIVNPNQDMVLGIYWLTEALPEKNEKKYFSNEDDAILAWQNEKIDIREIIRVYKVKNSGEPIDTTVGRILFNEVLPPEIEFINKQLNKSALSDIIGRIIENCDRQTTREILDKIKDLGFTYATYSGITWSMDDLKVPEGKKKILKEAEQEVSQIEKFFLEGGMTDDEKKDSIIAIWEKVKDKISEFVKPALKNAPSIYSIIDSGSRGSWGQVVQMVGMKGLVASPSNEIIERPVKSSFKEGFSVLEYFISTHGARKGTTDTALRTAAAGYLTRRLIDVAHDIIVNEEDCLTQNGITVYEVDCEEMGQSLANRLYGRVALEDIIDQKTGQTLVKKGEIIDKNLATKIQTLGIKEVKLRSPITCQNNIGICQKCYGWDLSHNKLVNLGEAVGIIAAQSIGEPGTQLTMRTFHMGGVAGSADITQGLPRVEEIFEVRHPKTKAIISTVNGIIEKITEKDSSKIVTIANSDPKGEETVNYNIPGSLTLWVKVGDRVTKGQQLTEGHIDITELYKTVGFEAVCRYILTQVQKIYTSKGADINDKHIEVIIRKLLSRVKIIDPGDTDLLPGKIVETAVLKYENERVKKLGLKEATYQSVILGISKISMTTDSFLSAASFQTTAQALIEAALEGKVDRLVGLKENVIIGRLIPAGTGFRRQKQLS